MRHIEKEYSVFERTCKACSNLTMCGSGEVLCQNFDCNIYYPKVTVKDKIEKINSKLRYVVDALNN